MGYTKIQKLTKALKAVSTYISLKGKNDMVHESVRKVRLIDTNSAKYELGKLFTKFTRDESTEVCITVLLATENYHYLKTDYHFEWLLKDLLTSLPEGFEIVFEHVVEARTELKKSLLKVEEHISIDNKLSNDEMDILKYQLHCNYEGQSFKVESSEEISSSIRELQKKLGMTFDICFCCEHAEFKSTGGEDLRHGWYCFREFDENRSKVPWFLREEDFDKAISNVSAFHWCPKFSYMEKIF